MSVKPKKEIINMAVASGVMDRVNQLFSAAYLLHSEASILAQEANELLNKYGMSVGSLKQKQNAVERTSKAYFDDFSSMVKNEKVIDWAHDLDQFNESFRKWAKVESEWEPKEYIQN